ncbi:unnamed protein product [Pleuronectes platessa]|uniref:Uncharacterized protein n=2 Tax=Pleuronectes platessa TaxID=8262 RepID=A0A9N7TQ96_PLEPL|nr:unnamed protein product [Pleuronectes platessa]
MDAELKAVELHEVPELKMEDALKMEVKDDALKDEDEMKMKDDALKDEDEMKMKDEALKDGGDEAELKDADVTEDLDQEQQEKEPMTGGRRPSDAPPAGGAAAAAAEKNGSVKLKIPEEAPEEVKFTGLSKEELLRVAGTPG